MKDLLKSVFNDFEYIFTPQEKSVAETPQSSLKDMWTVRWGNDWVSRHELIGDLFWSSVLARLLQDKSLETHYLPDRAEPVYRLKKNEA